MKGAQKGGSQGGGHISLPFWASRRSRLAEGGETDLFLQSPLDGANEHGWREDGFRSGGFLRSVKAREGVCLDIFISWSIGDGELEPSEEERPTCLAGIEPLGAPEVFKIFVVCDYGEGVLCSLQPVSPLLQSQLDSEQFSVPYVVVALRRGELPGEEGARMETRRLSMVLGQQCSHASSGGVYFYNKRELGIRMGEDGSSAEGLLELLEGAPRFGVPRQRLGPLAEHGGEGSGEEAEVLNKSAIEVGESEESLEFLNRLRLGPVTDSLDLPLVHLDAIRADDVPEELHCGTMELTLLERQVEVVFPELFQDLRDVVAMFGQVPGVN